ncbi:hypothetical protein [Mycobacterium colombiense]|uniref:hypothetical protein n=1 Tax=Mycobacterium colombiense TaxID=339268 RepID=UPI0022AB680E|nr:hypothetical protein [Mycobacterium colombiense]
MGTAVAAIASAATPGAAGRRPRTPLSDRKRGNAGRSGSPPEDPLGDRKRGNAGRSGSPPEDPAQESLISP